MGQYKGVYESIPVDLGLAIPPTVAGHRTEGFSLRLLLVVSAGGVVVDSLGRFWIVETRAENLGVRCVSPPPPAPPTRRIRGDCGKGDGILHHVRLLPFWITHRPPPLLLPVPPPVPATGRVRVRRGMRGI